MKNKYGFVALMLLVLAFAGVGLTGLYVGGSHAKGQDFRVVTSFYPMYIAALNITDGCDGVELVNLSEPQTGCLHDYQLTTGDMKKLSSADALIINGGGIESFVSEVAAQYDRLAIIDAGADVSMISDNAHAWMSIGDYMTQVETITRSLSALDRAHADVYADNCAAYTKKLAALLEKQRAFAAHAAHENVVIFHEAFAYVARDYGLTVAGDMDLDEERQVSAGEVADIVGAVADNGVRLILAEERYGKKMCETVKKETGAEPLYLDPCVRGAYEKDSYLKAMGHNLALMQRALRTDA